MNKCRAKTAPLWVRALTCASLLGVVACPLSQKLPEGADTTTSVASPAGTTAPQPNPAAVKAPAKEASGSDSGALALASLSLSPLTQTLPIGQSVQLQLTAARVDGSAAPLPVAATWSVDDPALAVVDNEQAPGLVSSLAAGKVTITATTAGLSAKAMVIIIDDGQMHSVAISPQRSSYYLGDHVVLSAIGFYGDGSQMDLTSTATFTLSGCDCAVLDTTTGGQPLLTAVGPGSALLTLTYGSKKTQLPIKITSPALQSIAITPPSGGLLVGRPFAFAATGTYADGSTHDLTKAVAWSSTQTAVLSFAMSPGQAGQGTVGSIGTTVVSAKLGHVEAQSSVQTSAGGGVTSMRIVTPTNIVPVGHDLNLTATATMQDNSQTDITLGSVWTSSDPAVATVTLDPAGGAAVLHPVSQSSSPVTITATYGGSRSNYVLITVQSANALTSITLVPSVSGATQPLAVTCGVGTAQFKAMGRFANQSDADLTMTDITNDTHITWSSDDATTAAPATGLPGEFNTYKQILVTVKATYHDPDSTQTIVAAGQIQATAPALTAITLASNAASLPLGRTFTFATAGVYSCGAPQTLNNVAYSVSSTIPNTLNFIVDAAGLARTSKTVNTLSTATSVTVQASATSNGVTTTAQSTVQVTPLDLVSLTITGSQSGGGNNADAPYIYVNEGQTLALNVAGLMTDGSSRGLAALAAPPNSLSFVWTTDDTSIATAANTGAVTGVSVGRTTVRVATTNNAGTAVSASFPLSTQRVCPSGKGLSYRNLYCVSLSAVGQSCTDSCTALSLTADAPGLSFLQNFNSTDYSNCQRAAGVLTSIDNSTAYLNVNNAAGSGVGCALFGATPMRFTYDAVTGAGTNSVVQRVCACR